MESAIHEFMMKHGMHPELLDMEAHFNAFRETMRRGLSGEPSSLMMIPSYMTLDGKITEGLSTAALDAGGTNLRIGLCAAENGTCRVVNSELLPMLGTEERIDAPAFFAQLAKLVQPYLSNTDRLGFCFSFPAEITPDLDGIVLGFNKEVQIDGASGAYLCRELDQALLPYGKALGCYAVVNDTVAALLGGYGSTDPDQYDGYIGMILGTGMNCCYTEHPENIKKLSDLSGGSMIINIEAGGYDGFPVGDFDEAYDRRSANPGDHLFEKMVSGGYLNEIAWETICGAVEEGILSPSVKETLSECLWTKDICEFLLDPRTGFIHDRIAGSDDRTALYTLFDLLLDRAARLVAVSLTAIMDQGDIGKTPEKPTCIVVEGSTFQKSPVYQQKIRRYLDEFCSNVHHRYYAFTSVKDANILGAAVAAMLR